MTPFDRRVRAGVYQVFLTGHREVTAGDVAHDLGAEPEDVTHALTRLTEEHRLLATGDGRVLMAHPFSGVETSYRSVVGESWWHANCAWDALALLALLGDGRAEGPDDLLWEVQGGSVEPDGVVHLLVPARRFWEDVGFT